MEEAIEEYRTAVRCDDQCIDAYVNLGAALQASAAPRKPSPFSPAPSN